MRILLVAVFLSVVATNASASTDCDAALELALLNCQIAEENARVECENEVISNFQCEQIRLACQLEALESGGDPSLCDELCEITDAEACFAAAAANRVLCDEAANDAYAACLLKPEYADAVLASGPVLYWSFEEGRDDPAQDRVTQLPANALVPQRGATRDLGLPGLGKAASFNGTSNESQSQPRFYANTLSVSGSVVFDHYAIEMWVKLNTGTGWQYLIEGGDGVNYNAPSLIHGFLSDVDGPSLEYFTMIGRTGATGPTTLNDSQWHHVVVEANVTTSINTIYIDGVQVLQSPFAAPWRLPALGVGATAYLDGLHGTNGLIDELAFYDLSTSSVTGADIAGHYFVMFPDVTSAPTSPALPTRSALHPSFPNPFNPSTSIRFHLAQAGAVELTIYDMAGRRVRTLVQETRAAGEHQVIWQGRDESGRRVASGVYLYRLEAGSYVETRRMTLLE